MKNIFITLGIITGIVVVIFGSGVFELEYKKYFAPKHAEVDRKIFEETKSYVHGKTQDLSKYFKEYQAAEDLASKGVIQEVVSIQFSDFDASNIKNKSLRNFLINMRGY